MSHITVAEMIVMVSSLKEGLGKVEDAYFKNRKRPNYDILFYTKSLILDLSFILINIRGVETISPEELQKFQDQPYLKNLLDKNEPKEVYRMMTRFGSFYLMGKDGHKKILGKSKLKANEKKLINDLGQMWLNFCTVIDKMLSFFDKCTTLKDNSKELSFKKNVLKTTVEVNPFIKLLFE